MKKKYQSKILQAIHEDAKEFHEEGLISDARMRHYDKGCLVQEPVKKLPKKHKTANSAGIKPVTRMSAKSAGL